VTELLTHENPHFKGLSEADVYRGLAAAGVHRILLDALGRTALNYLREHPHLRIADIRPTISFFSKLAAGKAD
jgi:hypothetical protein